MNQGDIETLKSTIRCLDDAKRLLGKMEHCQDEIGVDLTATGDYLHSLSRGLVDDIQNSIRGEKSETRSASTTVSFVDMSPTVYISNDGVAWVEVENI